ncbi:MAG: PHP domain-containing protein [Candidatus Omnitrophica bacterium]|nr:PHP domain-containing protein [Candidatus Omnitrophota bacterium]MDE2009796.1 PHP domain-containing protein [Candidatus Omnitrophota bacterium]MDE2215141.1 PHP domain-containing protein [Candidatus Omnitrophota bacterium]MDE2231495.1 PHP domain-containing protein [Candidatus Omnitrophota bacterium]
MPSNADLHIHTYFSDSTASPQEVVDEAVKAGLSHIAITDHDIVQGVAAAMEAAGPRGLEVVPGVELSSEFEGCDIHILGYFIDHQQGPLAEKINDFLDARQDRMKRMITKLKSIGIDNIEFEEVAALTHSRAVGRSHLAMMLLNKGWVNNIRAAFEKYIGPGCPGYAPKYKQTPFEAIDLIRKSGGVAVMAHPMLTQKDELIPRLKAAGLKGLEVYYPNTTETVIRFYERIAQKNGLTATGGSDAHGKAKPYTHIGKQTVPSEVVEQLRRAKDE